MKLFVEVMFGINAFIILIATYLVLVSDDVKEIKGNFKSIVIAVLFFIWTGYLLWRGY